MTFVRLRSIAALPRSIRRTAAMVLLLAILLSALPGAPGVVPTAEAASTTLVISQVYGGGGSTSTNPTPSYKNDYVELFNRSSSPVTITNWSIQYASSAGSTWQVSTICPAGCTIGAGKYFLVQEGTVTNATGATIPTPDSVPGALISMSASAGKVALVNNITALSGATPTSVSIVDFVGYGNANFFEGSGGTPTLNSTTAVFRANGGCTDTDQNSTDFATGTPSARNSSSAANPCGGGGANPSGTGSANPSSVLAGGSTVLTVAATQGTGPSSPIASVTADLASIGGSANQAFSDDGMNGDVTAGDSIYSFQATVAGGISGGNKTLPFTVTDGLSRAGSGSISLTVVAPTNPSGVGSATPNSVSPGDHTTLKVTVTPGSNPTSTALVVNADLSSIGGSANQLFFDDGTNGDTTAADNVFSYATTVAVGTTTGAKSIPVIITDGQSRSGNATISLSVSASAPVKGSVVISQIYGGGGNNNAVLQNDFIEIFNRSNAPVNLTGWSVQYTSQSGPSGATWSGITPLTGVVLAPGQYYLIREASGGSNGGALPTEDAPGSINMSATDGKVALVSNTSGLAGPCPLADNSVIDMVGYGGATCSEGGATAPRPSAELSIIRARSGCKDTDINQANFTTGTPNPRNTNTATNICPAGDDAPEVFSATPGDGSSHIDLAANITLNFDEPVNVTGTWYQISCVTSGAHTATVSGGPSTFTINPDVDFASDDQCTVTVLAGQVNDIDTNDPPDNMAANYVLTFTTNLLRNSSEHLEMGNPSNATQDVNFPSNYLLPKLQYVLSYDRDNGRPNWVSWHLDSSWLGGGQRQDDFRNDPSLPAGWYQVQGDDFQGSGFDRGHMTPSADRLSTNEDNSATFFMTNMIAQSPDNNQGPWANFETYTRTLLNGSANEVYIVSGPYGQGGVGANGAAETITNGHVSVPSKTWKVVMVLPTGTNDASRVTNSTRTIALIMPNVQGIRNDDWKKYIATVDQVEALTGFDFFSSVDPAMQSVVESTLDSTSNTAPVAANQSVTTSEDTALNITLTATDFNVNNVLTYTVTGNPAHGTLSMSGGGVIYTPAANYSGPDSFKFKANDGAANSNEATVSINVNPVNDAPSLSGVPGFVTISELSPYTFTATASDVDVPAQALTFSLVNAPEGASIDPSTGVFTWTPTEAQGGTGSPFNFTVTVSDGTANADATISVTVEAVNDLPSAMPASVSTDEDTPLNIALAGNDAETPAADLIYTVTVQPQHGSLVGTGPNLNYVPSPNYSGADSFQFTVTDTGEGASGALTSAPATVSISVNSVNDAPVLAGVPSGATINELAPFTFTASATDFDGDALTFSLVDGPAGAAIDPATGVFTWTPSEAQGGTSQPYTFKVLVSDGHVNVDATVVLNVGEVNQAPMLAVPGIKLVSVRDQLSFTAQGTDADLPAQSLTYSLVGPVPDGAAIDPVTGVFTWTPDKKQDGTYILRVRVTDNGPGNLSAERSVLVLVAKSQSRLFDLF